MRKTMIVVIILLGTFGVSFAQIVWDRQSLVIFADSTQPNPTGTARVYLINGGTTPKFILNVFFEKGDLEQFQFTDNEANYYPLADYGHPFKMNPGDSIWTDINFRPDISEPYPLKFADRHAECTVEFSSDGSFTIFDSSVMQVTGTFDLKFKNTVRQIAEDRSGFFAFIQGQQLIIHLPTDLPESDKIQLYDLLGRLVFTSKNNYTLIADYVIALPLPELSSGIYAVRAGTRTCQVMK